MAVRLIVTFTALPGKGADFARAFAPVIEEVLEEPGCEQYELFVSQADPDKLVLLERWADEASLEAHSAANRARGASPTAPFRAGAPLLERFAAS
jgi:quinol monooxygenase YgiN